MPRAVQAVLLGLVVALCHSSGMAESGVDTRAAAPKALRMWVDARAGTGAPVHWVSEGSVYEYPSGKKLFGMIGFDSSTVIWPEKAGDPVLHLTRKTYTYTDAKTGEILKEYNGEPVTPVAYPYQLITYRLEDGRIFGDVEQGVKDRVQFIKAENGLEAKFIGNNTLFVNAPVFLDIPIGGEARMQAWENYDFFIHDENTVDEPHQLSWQRYGDLPPWAGGGKGIFHLLSWRVESHEDFPPQMLAWAQAEMPFWLNPPEDLEEIRDLQENGLALAGW